MTGAVAWEGCPHRPPRIEVARVEALDGPVATVVVRGWRGFGAGDALRSRVMLLYRLRVGRRSVGGAGILAATLNGCTVVVDTLPGIVRDVAVTVALDAIGARAPGWGCS